VEEDVALARTMVERRGLLDRARITELAWGPEVRFDLPESALVSIVIPFTDKAEMLRQCVESIQRLTTHRRWEIILVDTRSVEASTEEYLRELSGDPRVTIIRIDEPFNYSRANNTGAFAAKGDFLVFLNNDTRLLTPDWLEQLCGYAALEDIGAVGAKLLYPNGSLQHAGVVVGMQGYAGHLFSGEHEPFVPVPWIRYTRNCSAVTGACLAIERGKFLDNGGFDERLTLTGNDVELCLRLLQRGLRNVLIPSVSLFHYEKATRNTSSISDHNKKFSLFTYRDVLQNGDPYYNTNLDLSTTSFRPRTAIKARDGKRARATVVKQRAVTLSEQFLRENDLSEAQIAANARLIESFDRYRTTFPATITWFIPHFDHIYRGGICTIMRIAERFSIRCESLNRFVFYGRASGNLERMKEQIETAFPRMLKEMVLLGPGQDENELPPSDLAFCTLWSSAYPLARYNRCRGKFYLIQDFEAGFTCENSVQGLVEQTYRLGFVGVANTPGVCDVYRGYGNEAEYFIPAVDRTIFRPAPLRLPGDVTRVIFYGRPDKPRNAFALAAESLRELKIRHGDRVEIVSVGSEYDVGDFGLEGVVVNLGLLPDLQTVASFYRQSDIGVVFMLSKHPSYQPLEYMASGCAVVTNRNEANAWLLRHRENAMVVPPLRTTVVEAIEELIADVGLRRKIVAGGLETVSRANWDEELDVIVRFVTTGEGRDLRSPTRSIVERQQAD
jgi:GT2 family glycosyltransferase/glycosyltransferase involved in cell wall biosynthesis